MYTSTHPLGFISLWKLPLVNYLDTESTVYIRSMLPIHTNNGSADTKLVCLIYSAVRFMPSNLGHCNGSTKEY